MKFLIKFFTAISIVFLSAVSCSSGNFDETYAFSVLVRQCEFGARVPGTEAHENCVKYLKEELAIYCDSIYTESFNRKMSYSKEDIEFTNIIGIINSELKRKVMIFSHYDSRPFSSEEGKPTMGANDGASSTALLMAMAKYIKENKIDKRIEIVFFDGEDGGTPLHRDEWFVGSQNFAQNYDDVKPETAILVDMIGDKDLKIYKEGNSELYNSELNGIVFGNAKKLKESVFENRIGYFVEDDHIPLNTKGFKCIDIIDMDYKWWHTPYDTPDKCSKESLKSVASVLLKTIYER